MKARIWLLGLMMSILAFTFSMYDVPFSMKEAIASNDRIYGADRYWTAVEVAKKGWTTANTVILARGDQFPDALAGAPLAYKEDAPILLTPPDTLHEGTKRQIESLQAKKVIILGSTMAVSANVEKELEAMGLAVERIAGSDRYDTAVKIAVKVGIDGTAIIADGRNFPDALAIAPYAAKNGCPILLVGNEMPEAVKSLLPNVNRSIVVGGEHAVSKEIYNQLKNPVRLGGADRFETMAKIVRHEYSGDVASVYVATGTNFADALTGSVLAAKQGRPILLVRSDRVPSPVMQLVKDSNMKHFTFFGGPEAIQEKVMVMLKNRQIPPDSSEEPPDAPRYITAWQKDVPIYDDRMPEKLIIVGYLRRGQSLPFVKEFGENWYQIKFGNGFGYILKKDVRPSANVKLGNENRENLKNSNTVVITQKRLDVYDNSSGKLVSFGVLEANRRYPVIALSRDKKWYKIDFGGRIGYIHYSAVKIDKGIPVLMYHHILKDSENKRFKNVSTTISDDAFAEQMEYLHASGYEAITLSDLEKYLKRSANLPGKVVVITFDDGLKSIYLYAYPILKKFGFHASEFMITSRIPDKPVPFHPDKLQTISRTEMEEMKPVFEFHSHTHGLHSLDEKGKSAVLTSPRDIVKADIRKSQETLNGTRYFAYPFGQYHHETVQILRELGFQMAFTTNPGRVNLGDSLLELKRINVGPDLNHSRFIQAVAN